MTTSTRRAPRRPRPGDTDDHEEQSSERWLVSYSDMVTVLLVLFIVLFAMSNIDKQKLEQFAGSFTGTVPATSNSAAPPSGPRAEAQIELDELIALRAAAQAALDRDGLGNAAQFNLSENGLTIQLVGTETYFAGNSIELSNPAVRVLNAVGPVIAGAGRTVSVEGHAEASGTSGPFASDWELSSGRATQVLRHLVETNGVPAHLIGATGYGSARPAGTDESTNRRVDIAIETTKPDDVRAAMAELLAAAG